ANVNHIVVGKSERSRLFELVNGSVVHDLVRDGGNICVHVVPGEAVEPEKPARRAVATAAPRTTFDARPYLIALVAVGAGLGAAIVAQPYAGVENADLFLLTAVVGVAVWWGLGPALAAVVASSLAYNFFF
ncbi:DUF4118 domain-containing protein, partial [Escherichia coli]|uniref:DUF4118 domain-containing protein n=1 Tax=Escherichia coli TaxID=562 RepID=UPI00128FDFC1